MKTVQSLERKKGKYKNSDVDVVTFRHLFTFPYLRGLSRLNFHFMICLFHVTVASTVVECSFGVSMFFFSFLPREDGKCKLKEMLKCHAFSTFSFEKFIREISSFFIFHANERSSSEFDILVLSLLFDDLMLLPRRGCSFYLANIKSSRDFFFSCSTFRLLYSLTFLLVRFQRRE